MVFIPKFGVGRCVRSSGNTRRSVSQAGARRSTKGIWCPTMCTGWCRSLRNMRCRG